MNLATTNPFLSTGWRLGIYDPSGIDLSFEKSCRFIITVFYHHHHSMVQDQRCYLISNDFDFRLDVNYLHVVENRLMDRDLLLNLDLNN